MTSGFVVLLEKSSGNEQESSNFKGYFFKCRLGVFHLYTLPVAAMIVIPCSTIADSGEYRNGPGSSVHLSVHTSILAHSSMMAGWILFIFCTMIRYHGLLMHVKIKFGSMPNLSNYGHFS